jgi:hypothetical protein
MAAGVVRCLVVERCCQRAAYRTRLGEDGGAQCSTAVMRTQSVKLRAAVGMAIRRRDIAENV